MKLGNNFTCILSKSWTKCTWNYFLILLSLFNISLCILLFNSKESSLRILHVCGCSGIQNFTLSVGKYISRKQRAKKVLSDSAGLVDFAIRLANSVSDLPDGQVISFEEFE